MKKNLTSALITRFIAICFVYAFSFSVYGQEHDLGHSHNGITEKKLKPISSLSYSWKLIDPLGLRELAEFDTLMLNYYRNYIPSAASEAWATTGNYGAQGINMIFHEREAISDFFFRDASARWLPSSEKMRFYNTRIPMTLLSFNAGGTRETSQERLQGIFSGNINSKAQIGGMIDYPYSKGSYSNQAAKGFAWGLSGSYLGDRYELQAYFNKSNILNKESGGITDMLYITDPAELQGGITTIDPKSIPTKLSNAHTNIWGTDIYVNNRYKVGYWHEETADDDSTVVRTYIPVTSFIHTLRYKDAKHLFIDTSTSEMSRYFENIYLDPTQTNDVTNYWSLSNTVGISLLEGFNKYAKFGLAAYITHQVRRYTLPADTLDRAELNLTPFPENIGTFAPSTTQQLAWVGAQLTKQRGSILTYAATAELGFLGEAAGEIKAQGQVSTRFKFIGDSLDIRAFGEFRNETAPYLTQRYRSNHYVWQNDFGKRRTVTFGGEVSLGRTGTRLRASLSNLQNHIYFGADGPRQYGGSVQVLSLSLKQNFKVGILHWDNSITYQTSSNSDIIALPTLAVYSNLYLLFRIATLHAQLGVDCNYYTSYYAPAYQPALASFVNQNEYKIGNYPFCNAYLNMKLSRTRFYIMYTHANRGLFGGSNYFSVPFYPLNPARLQFGVCVDFVN
ncbi:MAG: putative porin [Muribaculaceae bacterium]|nr:putative porin [Muribaculaceae bacterium]